MSPVELTGHALARMIDISAVQAQHGRADVEELAGHARRGDFVAAHVLPSWLPVLRPLLDGSQTNAGSPVGFPSGGSATRSRSTEARWLLDAGVQEMDVVMNIGLVRSGELAAATRDVAAVLAAVDGRVPVKVILEVGLLDEGPAPRRGAGRRRRRSRVVEDRHRLAGPTDHPRARPGDPGGRRAAPGDQGLRRHPVPGAAARPARRRGDPVRHQHRVRRAAGRPGRGGDGVTPDDLRPAARPTLYFVGVSTASSAIHRVFAAWRPLLGLSRSTSSASTCPSAPNPAAYRRVVEHLRDDPLSRGALVTTHKLDLYSASRDLLRRGQRRRRAAARGQRAGGPGRLDRRPGAGHHHQRLALRSIVERTAGRDVLVMGAGGAALALCDYFAHRAGADAPGRVVVTDIAEQRLAAIAADVATGDPAITWRPNDSHPVRRTTSWSPSSPRARSWSTPPGWARTGPAHR